MTITLEYITKPMPTCICPEVLTVELIDRLRPLMEANHAAAGIDAPLNPDLWLIQGMQPRVWVAWHEGQPVGYCAHIVSPHPLTQEMHATCLAIYLEPAHRAKARALVKRVEHDLAGTVAVIAYNVPHWSKAGAFFEHKSMGYHPTEIVMSKRMK